MPEAPRLSVVIPMRNCGQTVCTMLDSLRAQNIAMQIIVVDDASEDDSVAQVTSWSHQHAQAVELVYNDRQLFSYTSRLKGLARVKAPVVWCVDADDIIPPNANVPEALAIMEREKPDILHCKACGILSGQTLQKPLTWTEPVAEHLDGDAIVSTFMAQDYPPAILWNKFFSARVVKKVIALAPDLEVRYFDVKFLGLLFLLCSRSYMASNELIYEYRMRSHRPSWLYARQVHALLLLQQHMGSLVQQHRPDLMDAFITYCQRRLVIQAGHLSLMARHELQDRKDSKKWFENNILPNIPINTLLSALNKSIEANVTKLQSWATSICQLLYPDGHASLHAPVFQNPKQTDTVERAVKLLLANAKLAGLITSIMAPSIDITKKAN